MDSLATYDFSIGPGDEDDNVDDDDEMAELEAARHGRFSDLRKKSKPRNSTLDGWTPPTRKWPILYLEWNNLVLCKHPISFFTSSKSVALWGGGGGQVGSD